MRFEDVFDADGRFTEGYLRRVVDDMVERVGWSREQAEEWVRVPDAVVRPVAEDLSATLGWTLEQAEIFTRQHSLQWAAGVPRVIVVAEAVQQYLHDAWIDTSWPACPDHPHHPLWLTRTVPARWRCPTSGRTFCELGEMWSLILGG